MAQNPLVAFVSAIFSATGAPRPAFALLNAQGESLNSNGGKFAQLNFTQPGLVVARAAKLAKIIVLNAGSAGNFIANDAASLAQAQGSNICYQSAFNGTAWYLGSIITPEIPLAFGLVISQMPAGATVALLYS